MEYKVIYQQEILANENVEVLIEADSEEEAIVLVKEGKGTALDSWISDTYGSNSNEIDIVDIRENDD